MSVRVIRPGILTTVQDLGRQAHQADGVPEGGAMDAHAARLANLLVGNDEGAAVLEATMVGPALEFEAPALVALAGGSFDATLGGSPIGAWRAFVAKAGSVLDVGSARAGCRVYVAIAGGFDVPPVLGSRSTYLPAAFGGFHGRALRTGDVLASGSAGKLAGRAAHAGPPLARSMLPTYGSTVRFIPADADAVRGCGLLERDFRVSGRSDRMGYRLEGDRVEWPGGPDVLSAAVTMGTVQLPLGGSPILLMADRQTTGGYPVLGQVATIDLGSVAQLRPGDGIRFAELSLDEAQRLYLERERAVGALRRALLHLPRPGQ